MKLGLRGDWSDKRAAASAGNNAAFSPAGAAGSAMQPRPKPAEPMVTGTCLVQIVDDPMIPLEVVVTGLEQVFGLTGAEAIRIAQAVTRIGRATCAGFDDWDEAQRKADELTAFAKEKGCSLTCLVAQRVWT
jgi:ATP-dependent Clp protease adapter protein ClpS